MSSTTTNRKKPIRYVFTTIKFEITFSKRKKLVMRHIIKYIYGPGILANVMKNITNIYYRDFSHVKYK